jgi:hypothetical protein
MVSHFSNPNKPGFKSSPDFNNSQSLKRRLKGTGSGSIQRHFVQRRLHNQYRTYEQYWYHYELWQEGKCIEKSSVYIPKQKLQQIQVMNENKEPVKAILNELGKTV